MAPTRFRVRLFAGVAAAAALATPPAEARPTGPFTTTMENMMLTMRDQGSGRVVLSPNNQPIVTAPNLEASVELRPDPAGFDVAVRLENRTSEPQDMPQLVIGGWRLPQRIQRFQAAYDGEWVTDDHRGQNYFGPELTYPEHLYSPLLVLKDQRYLIGVSLHYPILEYRHAVRVMLRSPGGIYNDTGRCWETAFFLEGQIPAGATREYVLAVRAVSKSENFLRVLVPYRDYFRSVYGGPQYQRDPRPVLGETIAEIQNFSDDNPDAFGYPNRRPDVHGWGPWARHLRTYRNMGYERLMNWAPSGLLRRNRENNFPFMFMTHMNHYPAMRNSLDELRALGGQIDLGFWWGHSTKVMREWDAPGFEFFNINNPDHVARANAELDMAVAAGARTIGLDAFGFRIPGWEAHEWLTRMQQRAPGVRFVTEAVKADYLHALAPTFLDAHRVRGPHLLADFLNPGHELWAGIMFNVYEDQAGRRLSDAQKREIVRQIAEWGYVPVVFFPLSVDSSFTAAESWRTTVPADLQVNNENRANDDEGDGDSSSEAGRRGGVVVPPWFRATGRSADLRISTPQTTSEEAERAREDAERYGRRD